jgi:hypothetical protein
LSNIANYFVPNRQQVAGITNANPAVVTTTQNHGYLSGLLVRFYFPINFGMTQVNGIVYPITVLSPTTFSIPVDSTNYDVFSILSTSQVPEVIPVGEGALTLTSAVVNNQNIIPEL